MSNNKGETERSKAADGKKSSLPKQSKKTTAKLVVKEVEAGETGLKISPQPRVVHTAPLVIESEKEIDGSDEQITRLERPPAVQTPMEKSASVKFEKIESAPTSEDRHEHDWEKPMSIGWWVLFGGGAMVFIVVAAVFLSNKMEGLAMKEVEAPDIKLAEVDPFEGSPEQWFRQRAGAIGEQSLTLMKSYLAAQDDQSRSQYVRNPKLYLQRASEWPEKVRPRLEGIDQKQWDIHHIEETAYLTLDTENQDFLPTRLYFVRHGNELKLDWMASTAWCDRSISDLKKAMIDREKLVAGLRQKSTETSVAPAMPAPVITEPVLLRCLLARRNEFYAGPYNDQDHAAYMILSPDKNEYLWAYVDRDSELDGELRKLLDHGSFVVDLKKDIRVTVRVRSGKKDALPSQLELMELVHPEWVKP